MYAGQFILSQVRDEIPKYEFHKCVDHYEGNRRVCNYSCMDQLLGMVVAQLTCRESRRDIETCLIAMNTKFYRAGIHGRVSRSMLADANETRDWRINAAFAQVVVAMARKLYANDEFGVPLDQTACAFDSSTIDLCLSLFPWAKFRKRKAAVKLRTLIGLGGSIPCVVRIFSGQLHEVNVLYDQPLEPDGFYVMDRGRIDFKRLHLFA